MSKDDPGKLAAQASGIYHELILAATGDGIYGLDASGHTIFANPAACRMTGYSLAEMMGVTQHELIHHTHTDGRHYPKTECPIYAAIMDGEIHQVTGEVFWRKDGTSFPVEYISTPIISNGQIKGAVVSFRDVTQRVEAETALKESEERYRNIFNASQDAIFLFDGQSGAAIDANLAAISLLGIARADLPSVTDQTLFQGHPISWSQFRASINTHSHATSEEFRCVARSGASIPVHLSACAIPFEGRQCILIMAHDLRARLTAEQKARKLQSDLTHAARLSAMGEMASGMAHELNQPLTAVTNYTQAARRTLQAEQSALPANALDLMDKAVTQARRAGDIIRRLRQFVEKGDADMTLEDANATIDEALELIFSAGASCNLTKEFAHNLPAVLMDKIRIQQVLVNLVRNALEAMEGSEAPSLQIVTENSDTGILISIKDNGPGVPEDMEPGLFQSFVTSKPGGMGVGLSICRSIIDDHGGRLWAERNPGQGMTFSFSLPISPDMEDVHD